MEDVEINNNKKGNKLTKMIIIAVLIIIALFIYIRFIATHGFIVKE